MLDTFFLAAQGVQLVGLLALFALPLIGRRRAVFIARAAAGMLSVGYLLFFLPHSAAIPRDMGYSLDAIAGAFSTRELLLAGWIHYLVLDLFACSWEAEDAERSGVGFGALALCMFVTAMVAPLGLLLYFVVARMARRRPSAPRR
ncbi:MAG TPA: abscisic acid-deficient protein Aba4 family protein [Allosphingosinicella sp.]|jgi:hypothetical protein